MIYLLIAVIGIWFAVMGMFNSGNVVFHYVFGEITLPLVVVMLMCFVLGALLAMLVFGVQSVYWRGRAKSVEKQLEMEYREADRQQVKQEFEAVKQS